MKKATMGLGVAVIALAGGVTFCGDAFDEEFTDTVAHHDGTTDEPQAEPVDDQPTAEQKPWKLELTLATQDSPAPVFFGFRDGDNGWRHPSVVDGVAALEVYDPKQRYTVLTACEFADAKGTAHVDLTLIEATVAELPNPRAICRTSAESERDTQLAGAIRGTSGKDIDVTIGSRTFTVENEKAADGLLFTTDVASGEHTVVATLGHGSKARMAALRGVDLSGPTAQLEMSMADHSFRTTPAELGTLTPGTSQMLGGRAYVWLDGRTRIQPGAVKLKPTENRVMLSLPSTNDENDILDITTQFRAARATLDQITPLAAQARILTSASSESTVVFPDVSGAVASKVRFRDAEIDLSWHAENWSVLGFDQPGELTMFMPTAMVARLTQNSGTRRTLDVIVTPFRATGQHPEYTVPNMAEIEHFDADWSFRPDATLHARAGNLSAHAGTSRVMSGEAIAAYLESAATHGPADFMSSGTLTTLVTGLPPVVVDATTDFSDLRREACNAAADCIAKVTTDPRELEVCDALSVYRDCDAAKRVEFTAEKDDFATDLKREITGWYVSQNTTFTEDARTLDEALANIDVTKVQQMDPLEWGERFSYDLDKYQVFYHVDPVYPRSKAVWYGAYLYGRLVSITPVNLEYEVREFLDSNAAGERGLTVGPEPEALLDFDGSHLKDAWPTVIPPSMRN